MPDQSNVPTEQNSAKEIPSEELPDPAVLARQHLAARLAIRPPAGSRIKLDWNQGYPRLVIPYRKARIWHYLFGTIFLFICGLCLLATFSFIQPSETLSIGDRITMAIIVMGAGAISGIFSYRLMGPPLPQVFLLKKTHCVFDTGCTRASIGAFIIRICDRTSSPMALFGFRRKLTLTPAALTVLHLGKPEEETPLVFINGDEGFYLAPDLRPEDRIWLHDYLFGHYLQNK
ncbi:hypothetical protein [Kiloniella laminariae]|uniref:hypothetical protein n=1 Tax=Kiloniella laminariae TaxID=454162 RepID=UPI00036A4EC5|nr:hypothetical protein [Kiloniella laminariae]